MGVLAQALMHGLCAQVMTVDGKVDLKIPPGTQPGTTLVLGKRGVPRLGTSAQNTRGDHNVRMHAVIDQPCGLACDMMPSSG